MEAMGAGGPKPAFRKVDWLARDIETTRRADGTIVMRSRIALDPYEMHVPAYLARWAIERPDHVWLAQRRGPDRAWSKITYAQGKRTVDALTQALLDRGLGPDRPVAILSGNSLEHAMLTQAAMQARAPAAPISPAYSLMSEDHLKLKTIFARIRPGLVLVQDGVAFAKALAALDLDGVTVVHVDRPLSGIESVAFSDLAATPVTADVAASVAAIDGDTVGKLLFTSGSTGMPKGVINTQRMMCANVTMSRQSRPRGADDPPGVLLDWMPWNHTMGGNAMFNSALADGSTLYIDDGRPVPGLFDETLRNLREISPTYYANVPAGYAVLATALETDDALRDRFFRDLTVIAYGGARLPDDLYERMQALAVKATGKRIVFTTGWGSTETAPTATSTYWETERVGLIGLPFPGIDLKLVPSGRLYELRLRGVTVTPGYYGQPDLTAAAFDEEGFYKIGDAGTLCGRKSSGRRADLCRPCGGGFQAHHRHLCACRLAAGGGDRGDVAGHAGCPRRGTGSAVRRSARMACHRRVSQSHRRRDGQRGNDRRASPRARCGARWPSHAQRGRWRLVES